jgi:hypothetical protein
MKASKIRGARLCLDMMGEYRSAAEKAASSEGYWFLNHQVCGSGVVERISVSGDEVALILRARADRLQTRLTELGVEF